MTRILTTHVGSLPRPQPVVDFVFAKERGEQYDKAAFNACIAENVSACIAKQKEAGVDIVSDGEMSKISYSTYIKDRYTGYSGDSPRKAPADLQLFPRFLERIAASGGTPEFARPMCTGEIRSKDTGDLEQDIANMKAGMAENGVERGFMNAASPGVVAQFLPNAFSFYKTREDYLMALAEVLKAEYEAITSAGLDLQIDCPDLALARHVLHADESEEAFVASTEANVNALKYALQNVPMEQVRVHICWGNYEGPHVCDIGLNAILSRLLSTNAKYFLFEGANPRHAHEWTVFRDRAGELSPEAVLIPGVVDTTSNFVEHPELVAQRLANFISIVGADRVMAGTDCGFGTFAGFGAIDADIAYAKLATAAEGAAIASRSI